MTDRLAMGAIDEVVQVDAPGTGMRAGGAHGHRLPRFASPGRRAAGP
jgi:hypothetical protein